MNKNCFDVRITHIFDLAFVTFAFVDEGVDCTKEIQKKRSPDFLMTNCEYDNMFLGRNDFKQFVHE